MRSIVLGLVLSFSALFSAAAQVKVEDLAKPPEEAEQFTIMSVAGVHGHSARWKDKDGVLHGRESLLLRGQLSESDSNLQLGKDGMIEHLVIRGFSPRGDAAETFDIKDGVATWKTSVDSGSAKYVGPARYDALGGPKDLAAGVIETVIAATGRTLRLLPGGEVHAEPLTTMTVGDGAKKETVQLYLVTGWSNTPSPRWVDSKGRFFAQIGGLTWIRAGYEAFQPQIEKAQVMAMAKQSPAILKTLLKTPEGAVAFTHVRSFVDGTRFVEDETVVVEKGVITQVGPTDATNVPAGAQVIDGRGKTLVPGLWDAHQHVGGDAAGPMLLALGITSVRDPGNNNRLTLDSQVFKTAGDFSSTAIHRLPPLLRSHCDWLR